MPRDNPIGKPLIELSEVDSSNNYAMRQVQAQLAEHGATWFAWHQIAGKGQRGKTWNTAPGMNIILSTVIKPTPIIAGNKFMLSAMIALACYDFFSGHALADTTIKWPNDIYWKDRKAGGILIENIINGKSWKFAIAGIGININQTLFAEEIKNAVSLKQITGKTYNVIELAKELCACLEARWQQLETTSFSNLLYEYNFHLYKRSEQVSFKKDNALFKAVVTGVNANGDLLINTGTETAVPYGILEWLIN